MKRASLRLLLRIVGWITVVCAFAAALPAAAANSPAIAEVPTLDGAGFATLAGGLAITGSWWLARKRRK
jgi:LPXTG-motif cell wall-anchored protein